MLRTLTRSEAANVRVRLAGIESHDDLSSWAREVLTGICTGSRVPPAVRHPLGFVCVQLYRGADWGLCMHMWGPSAALRAPAASPVHSHSWDLSSQVICGRLENTEICVTDEVQAPTHRVVEITSVDGYDFVHPTDRLVRYTDAASTGIEAGESYTLPAGIFHVSRPGATGLTVTVLLAEDRSRSPELALGRLDAGDQATRRQACPVSDLQSMASISLHALDARIRRARPRDVS